MLSTKIRTRAAAVALAASLSLCWPSSASAQAPVAPPTLHDVGRRSAPAAVPSQGTPTDPDAGRTRDELYDLLQKYPPSVGRVLKLDPALLSNDSYLTPYPALTAFLVQHPDVRRNPAYFLSRVSMPSDNSTYIPESPTMRLFEEVMAGLAVITGGVIIVSALGWLVRTLIDYRRWHRLSKIQADAHAKLLDRLTANEELLSYVQSPAGSRFLQSAPISLDAGARPLGAPFGRILWSGQVGVVLAAGGFGLQYVSGRILSEATQAIYGVGVLAVALGVGFGVSALVSYVMARRLGLIEGPGTKAPVGE